MARSLNKAELIGNLTRDPELRYTPQGTAVCTFGVATNRQWTTDTGEKKEDVEFHRIVAWTKLAELCAQLLAKGRKVYVQGRLQTRRWTAQDGTDRTTTEIVINEMIILDSRFSSAQGETFDIPDDTGEGITTSEDGKGKGSGKTGKVKKAKKAEKSPKPSKSKKKKVEEQDDIEEGDDIPF
jgi:single-strand DNA-binding protein